MYVFFFFKLTFKLFLPTQNNGKKQKGEPDSTPEIVAPEVVTAEEEEEEDDGFEYDPLKYMCIYCRHQVTMDLFGASLVMF